MKNIKSKPLSVMIIILTFAIFSLIFPFEINAQVSSKQLTVNPYKDRNPSWNANGSEILYVAFSDSWYRHIWVMNNNGSEKTQLTFGDSVNEQPVFSPDGSKIAFTRWGFRGDYSDIMIMDSNGSNIQRLTFNSVPGKPEGTYNGIEWSQDGTKLIFMFIEGSTGTPWPDRKFWICTMNPNGTDLTVIGRGIYPKFVYGDTKVLFNTELPEFRIAIMNADGTNAQNLTNGPADHSPDMAKSSHRIIFTRAPAFGELGDIYIMEADGSNQIPLIDDGQNVEACWSPDEKYVAYTSDRSGNYDIWRVLITPWQKHPTNPVLNIVTGNSWENYSVWSGNVLFNGTSYKMWYNGGSNTNVIRIGYATSPDGIEWTRYSDSPVLDIGSSGSWDDLQVSNPSVIFNGSMYCMWYSGNDGGTMRIGLATSPDGISWTKHPGNPILSASGWEGWWVLEPCIRLEDSIYKMWYTGYDGTNCKIGYATSTDGISWVKNPTPVLDIGGSETWDSVSVRSPTVISNGSEYHMWYGGDNDRVHSEIGHAISLDGVNWQKDSNNPVLGLGPDGSWDDWALNHPFVLSNESGLRMWYSGHDGTQTQSSPTYHVRIGLATHLCEENHDVSVINVTPSPSIAFEGEVIQVNVTVRNEGAVSETFNVTSFFGNQTIGTIQDIVLAPSWETDLSYYWNTSGCPGNHIISANASFVYGEIDISDNFLVNGIVEVVALIDTPVKGGENATIEGNVTITNALMNKAILFFEVSGPSGSTGWLNITFPMINRTNLKLRINGEKIEPPPWPVIIKNTTHYFIYFEFNLSSPKFYMKFWWPYDITGDDYCGIDDIVIVAEKFGTGPWDIDWHPVYDINDDGYVGIDDIVETAGHFGETA